MSKNRFNPFDPIKELESKTNYQSDDEISDDEVAELTNGIRSLSTVPTPTTDRESSRTSGTTSMPKGKIIRIIRRPEINTEKPEMVEIPERKRKDFDDDLPALDGENDKSSSHLTNPDQQKNKKPTVIKLTQHSPNLPVK